MKNYKKAFSLLEMVFAVVIIGIIASVAMPKLFNTKNDALVSTIKQDLVTVTSAIQGQYMLNRKVEKITDVVSVNNSIWEIEDKTIVFKEKDLSCLEVKLSDYELEVIVNKEVGEVCEKLFDKGMVSTIYYLN
ncbi:MAG: prepilin-type N-terminal cleavage/methylation domain-containing protein [Arcobacteraceae bacterium]